MCHSEVGAGGRVSTSSREIFRRAATFAAAANELQVLTAGQLHTPLSRADLTALSPGERTGSTTGDPKQSDLLFNYWD